MLQQDGKKHGYDVMILPPVTTGDGTVLSSTAVRERIAAGRIREAEEMLGHRYQLSGRATAAHTGRTGGLRIQNVAVDFRKQLPAPGEYPCLLQSDGERYPAVVRIGRQPTVSSGMTTVEVVAPGKKPEPEGKAVRLTFMGI